MMCLLGLTMAFSLGRERPFDELIGIIGLGLNGWGLRLFGLAC